MTTQPKKTSLSAEERAAFEAKGIICEDRKDTDFIPNRETRRRFAAGRAKQFGTDYGKGMSREQRGALFFGACALLKASGNANQSTYNVLRVVLYEFLNLKTGGCFPSHARIAKAADCARDTVIEALKVLEAEGILCWTHRLVRRCIDGVLRPQRSSNCYKFFSWFAKKVSPAYKSEMPAGTKPSTLKSSITPDPWVEATASRWLKEGLLSPSPS